MAINGNSSSNQENAEVIEEQNIVIIDYSVEQLALQTKRYTRFLRGWYDHHESLRFQLEVETKRDRLRSEARKI
jgi:hypothetical protein